MCRIAAIIQTGQSKVTASEVKKFLLNMEYFGRDACGIAYLIGDNVQYCKETGAPSKVIGPKFEENNESLCSKATAILLHTRAATHGSPQLRVNNHPIFGDKYAIVHNGIVKTDKKYDADGQTDTEQMLRAMEKHGITAGINRSSGQAAVIMLNLLNMNEIYFYKSNNASLSSAWDEKNHILFLASELSIINNSVNGRTIEQYSMESEMLYQYILSTDKCRIVSEPKLKSWGWFARKNFAKKPLYVTHDVYVGNNPPPKHHPWWSNYYSNFYGGR